jgi:N-acyl-D-aspartate/D-glutamate deacylase
LLKVQLLANTKASSSDTYTVLILKKANVLNAAGTKFLKGKDITIRSGKIVKIGQSSKLNTGSKVMDLTVSLLFLD